MTDFPTPNRPFSEADPEFQALKALWPWADKKADIKISKSGSQFATEVDEATGDTYVSVFIKADDDSDDKTGYIGLQYRAIFSRTNVVRDAKVWVVEKELSEPSPLNAYAAQLNAYASDKVAAHSQIMKELLPARMLSRPSPLKTIEGQEVPIPLLLTRDAEVTVKFKRHEEAADQFADLPNSPFNTNNHEATIPFTPPDAGEWDLVVSEGARTLGRYTVIAEPILIGPPVAVHNIPEGITITKDLYFRGNPDISITLQKEGGEETSLFSGKPDPTGRVVVSVTPTAGRYTINVLSGGKLLVLYPVSVMPKPEAMEDPAQARAATQVLKVLSPELTPRQQFNNLVTWLTNIKGVEEVKPFYPETPDGAAPDTPPTISFTVRHPNTKESLDAATQGVLRLVAMNLDSGVHVPGVEVKVVAYTGEKDGTATARSRDNFAAVTQQRADRAATFMKGEAAGLDGKITAQGGGINYPAGHPTARTNQRRDPKLKRFEFVVTVKFPAAAAASPAPAAPASPGTSATTTTTDAPASSTPGTTSPAEESTTPPAATSSPVDAGTGVGSDTGAAVTGTTAAATTPPPPPELTGQIKAVLSSGNTFERGKLEIQIPRVTSSSAEFPATIQMGTYSKAVKIRKGSRGQDVRVTIFERDGARELDVANWTGKIQITVAGGATYTVDPEITIIRPLTAAQQTLFDGAERNFRAKKYAEAKAKLETIRSERADHPKTYELYEQVNEALAKQAREAAEAAAKAQAKQDRDTTKRLLDGAKSKVRQAKRAAKPADKVTRYNEALAKLAEIPDSHQTDPEVTSLIQEITIALAALPTTSTPTPGGEASDAAAAAALEALRKLTEE